MAADFDLAALADFTASLGRRLDADQLARCQALYEHLAAANERLNLTRIQSFEDYLLKHLADSYLLLAAYPRVLETARLRVLDLGCGAGFPGLPLAILCPEHTFTEMDSTQKKVAYVAEAITHLQLPNARAEVGRGREAGRRRGFRHRFDLVVARAVGPTTKLLIESVGFLAPGAVLVAYKTPKAVAEEAGELQDLAARQGWTAGPSPVLELPAGAGARQFWLIRRT